VIKYLNKDCCLHTHRRENLKSYKYLHTLLYFTLLYFTLHTCFSPCETASRHIRCWKWMPRASMYNWTRSFRLTNTHCDMPAGMTPFFWWTFSSRPLTVQALFMQASLFSRPHSKKSSGFQSGNPVRQSSFKINRSPTQTGASSSVVHGLRGKYFQHLM
jgi:hypothetical protein